MSKLAKKIVGYDGGIECTLSGFAGFIIFVGIVCLVICTVMAGIVTKKSSYSDWGEDGISAIWIALGFATLIETIIVFFILKMGAEGIRLLKKLNNIPYGGKISESHPTSTYYCSACRTEVPKDAGFCLNCGQQFESDREPM